MPLYAKLVYKIIGAKILILLAVGALLYSSASSFIGYTLTRTIYLYQDEVTPQDGLGIISIYSGTAVTPVTGIVPPNIIERAQKVRGVVAWGEVTAPCLVNNTLAVIRGLSPEYYKYVGIKVVSGAGLAEHDYTGALVGESLARRLRIEPGDILVVDSYFTEAPLLLKVKGIVNGPPPYRYEVLVNLVTGRALRGTNSYSTVRIIFDPSVVDEKSLKSALGVNIKESFLLNQAILLIGKGWSRAITSADLQKYYISRMGIPTNLIVALALLSDALLSLLMIPLAWAISSLREKELNILAEEGIGTGAIKLSLGAITLPTVFAGILGGLLVPLLAPSVFVLGYPVTYTLDVRFSAVHTMLLLLLFGVGVATARVR